MTTKLQVNIDIRLQAGVRYDDESELWVSWCPALDIHSQGTTEERAKASLREALGMYVKYCFEQQILDNILCKRGFAVSKGPKDPKSEGDGGECIAIQPISDANAFDLTVPLPLESVRNFSLAA